jgi:2-amino-4-hydroxy-6-hydroxymethyldihydropteridine diphosphokinase
LDFKVARAYIGLGSNLGDGLYNLMAAWKKLGEFNNIHIQLLSNPYKTEPVGIDSEHWFTNAVGILETTLLPKNLLDVMLQVEKKMGRDRGMGCDRTIDLDILFYDDVILADETLSLPHPEIQNRLFVLKPLNELAPDLVHILLGKSIKELEAALLESGQHIEKLSWSR